MSLPEAQRGPAYTRLAITEWEIPDETNENYWALKGN
jgi:hypothetical protein